jgi:hypothetical protein
MRGRARKRSPSLPQQRKEYLAMIINDVLTDFLGHCRCQPTGDGHYTCPIHRALSAAKALTEACESALLREDIADSELGDQLRAAVAKAGAP